MDRKEIDSLLRLMKRQGVAEFTFKGEGSELSVRFAGADGAPVVYAPAHAPQNSAPVAAEKARPTADSRAIRSPIVGTFYRAPSPDAAAYISVGDHVHKGQVVCIVEAMKLLNQIESEVDGVVAEVLVDNGQPVQFGQDLFRLSPG